MNRWRAALVLASASLLTGGCVAAAIPVVAGGMMARGKLRDREPERAGAQQASARTAAPLPDAADPEPAPQVTALTELPPPSGAPLDAGMSRTAGTVRLTDLTALPAPTSAGSAEAAHVDAAPALRAYQPLSAYLDAQAARRARGEPLRSVVLAAGAALDAPRYVPCDAKPLAMLVDLDENAKGPDPDARWRRWQGDARDALEAEPDALGGIAAARRAGIAVIFTSARSPEGAPGVMAALEQVGLGRLEPGKTLFLRGQAAADDVRQTVAATHCVVALVGDEFSDFSDLVSAMDDAALQSAAVTDTMVAPLWGAGWFLLPNVVRSTATPSTNPAGGN